MYCIMRTEKRKRQDIGGLQRENNRTATEYNNQVQPGMDILNVDLLHSDGLERGVQQDGPEKAQHITAQEHRLREVQQETQRELDRLGAVNHREQTERERAKRLRRQADEQQAENRRLKATASQIQGETERQQRIARQLAEMNQKARREFAQTKKQIEQMKEQASQVKGFLTIAEQRQLDELYKGDELER